MKLKKNTKAATTMPLEYIIGFIVLAVLIVWAMLWYSGLGNKAMQLLKEFF